MRGRSDAWGVGQPSATWAQLKSARTPAAEASGCAQGELLNRDAVCRGIFLPQLGSLGIPGASTRYCGMLPFAIGCIFHVLDRSAEFGRKAH